MNVIEINTAVIDREQYETHADRQTDRHTDRRRSNNTYLQHDWRADKNLDHS